MFFSSVFDPTAQRRGDRPLRALPPPLLEQSTLIVNLDMSYAAHSSQNILPEFNLCSFENWKFASRSLFALSASGSSTIGPFTQKERKYRDPNKPQSKQIANKCIYKELYSHDVNKS